MLNLPLLIMGVIGPWQLLVIVALVVIFFGGKKIPELGKYIRHFDYVVATDGSGDFFTLDEALKAIPARKKCTVLVRTGQYGLKPEIKNKLIKITEDEGVTYGSPAI